MIAIVLSLFLYGMELLWDLMINGFHAPTLISALFPYWKAGNGFGPSLFRERKYGDVEKKLEIHLFFDVPFVGGFVILNHCTECPEKPKTTINMMYINETLLLFPRTVHFREAYPEHISQWERQIATDACGPDLYFCLVALDDYPRLKGYLNSKEYLFDFVVNAHILYDVFMSQMVVNGHDEGSAVELANLELRSVYDSRNDSPEVMGDALGAVYFELFGNRDKPVDAEYYF